MAIEGLLVKPEVVAPSLYREGTPDIDEAVGVTIEAYREFGYTPDEETASRTITAEFTDLVGLGYDGRLYVRPTAAISDQQLTDAAEGKRPEGVAPAAIYPNFWTPGTEAESCTREELDQAPAEPIGRLALFNADRETGVDPLLHHLKLPFDDQALEDYNPEAKTTQLKEIAKDSKYFTERHEGFELDTSSHRDYKILALMDRIRGINPEAENYVDPESEDFVLNRGWMRVPILGRRTVDGGSIVGDVRSYGGQLYSDGSSGIADPSIGVGLSAGPAAQTQS